jgi:hypothetical protein
MVGTVVLSSFFTDTLGSQAKGSGEEIEVEKRRRIRKQPKCGK